MTDVLVPKLFGYNKTLVAPPDKSISVRAVIALSYAVGKGRVCNISDCSDVTSAIDCMRRLGSDIELVGSDAYITGTPFRSADLFCGNSATTARLLIGLLSGLNGVFTIDGDKSLRSRPMDRVIQPLAAMGARIKSADGRLPITVIGSALKEINYMPSVCSAQVKSAVLLAGLNTFGETTVTEQTETRNHTEIMLRALGAKLKTDGNIASVSRSVLYARDIYVPGDISSAVYPMCIALIQRGRSTVKNVGLNPTRTAVLDLLRDIGASVSVNNVVDAPEPYGDITVEYGGKLRPFAVDAKLSARLIDELPVLCALACHIDGTTVISGAGELRHKESDRISATVNMLAALGADVEERADGMIINGGKPLNACKVDSRGDHRIAMSAAVAGCKSGVIISNADCVDVSYPHFFEEVIGG